MDASDVGSFGALSLLRRLPMESVVTSYPIDDEELTIGRDQSCSLRLYYPAVSGLHAKITFVERKAFLVVLGTNGVLLDDEPLFPAAANAPGPTTVPLQNNSVIEIHKKRFRFTYPPKHLRTALINTPTRGTPGTTRRPLRLSMIASAHVFTPRPSHDPQENLRLLQTPLRTPFSRDEEEIVLVQSNTPRVVEEDKDLIILDEVEPAPALVFPLPLPAMSQYPATPVRRPRPSLHRAVLIRSAQRAAIQRDIQMEEQQDVEEVEETIAAIPEEADDEVQEIPPPEERQEVSGWRKSLDAVKGSLGWAFRGLSVEPKEEDQEEPALGVEDAGEVIQDQENENYMDDEHDNEYSDEDDEQENRHTPGVQPPRPLGQFMTPQIPRISSQPRLSLGGAPDAGPRRVRVVAPWKVNEIQVPTAIKEEDRNVSSGTTTVPPSTPRSSVKRDKVTDEEREAIRARRRSAVATPDNFFKGQTPGSRRKLFPSLAPLPSPSFSQPSQSTSTSSGSQDSARDVPSTSSSSKAEEQEDTAVLLARMKQMVEGVKERQSLGRQSLSLSPRKRDGGFSLLAPNHATALRPSRILIEEDESDTVNDARNDDAVKSSPSEDVPPQTPRMSDLRHMFGRSQTQGGLSTPAIAGVRDMFHVQPQAPTETPQMDGLQEMLRTPVNYDQPPEQDKNDGEELPDEPAEEEVPARTARGKKAPGTKVVRRMAVPQSAPPKSTRASSQIPEGPDSGAGARRTRARTADGAVGQIPRATRGKATKATVPEPKEDEDDVETRSTTTATRGTRRTRQATDSSMSSHVEETESKPARKTRAKTPTLAAGSSTAKTGTTRRGARAKPIEVAEDENDDDPLDSLGRERVPTDAAAAPAPAVRARRAGGRSKAPVKDEDVEEGIPAGENETGTRATRARRTPVPRLPTPAATARGATRTRAAAVAVAVEAAIPENKENTPEPNDEEDGEDAKAGGAKARGGKAVGRGKASGRSTPLEAGEDGAASAVPPPKTRRTRATRA